MKVDTTGRLAALRVKMLEADADLAAIGPGLRESRVLETSGHGTALFTRAPDLVGTLVDWFQRTLL